MSKKIYVKGAREHNLKNIDIEIPRDSLVVVTGLSGSGKSSLAFDTIYAEGRRRYVESLSSYARMFLGRAEKPDVDYIEGLSPAISIDQKTTSKNPRSTVGTVTEIYDYLRLLWARTGIPHCPNCGKVIEQQTVDQICDKILSLDEGTKFQILAPVVRSRKGRHEKVFESAKKSGYVRARVDGNIYDLSEDIVLEKNIKHDIEIIIDRLVIKEGIQTRLTDSIETASNLSGGLVLVDVIGKEELLFSQNFACDDCGVSIEELSPRMFSFNNPHGACPDCAGLGSHLKVDPDMIIPDKSKSILDGAIHASGWANAVPGSICRMYYDGLAKHYGFELSTPICDIPKEAYNAILYGTGNEKIPLHYDKSYGKGDYTQAWEGLISNLERRYHETASEYSKAEIEECMINTPCSACRGRRLRPEALAVTVGGINISEMCDLSVEKAIDFINRAEEGFSERELKIATLILREIKSRLGFLQSVGLSYLTLSRSAGTLSGGESQRIRLATQIGASLMGVLYILDEPSIGLHQRDNSKLLDTLKKLRDLGNTLIVVEHDEDTMRAADFIVDVGPGAGVHGGEIVAKGTVSEIIDCENSITGQYLSGKKKIPVPTERRCGSSLV